MYRAISGGPAFVALLTHFGSRGVGARIAKYYTDLARNLRPHLPAEAADLAWLSTADGEGREYLHAMNLAARFAEQGHAATHRRLLLAAGVTHVKERLFNAHNLAWETPDGTFIHRKGATPAAAGQMGIIPGTAADPAYVVSGLGHPGSLGSASHGAGRVLGRRRAKQQLDRAEVDAYFTARGVTRLGGGIDEAPQAYKDIREVIAAQADLVTPVGTFQPLIVRMCDDDYAED